MTTMDAPQKGPLVTWTDYQSWTDDQRWEIIGGHPYAMTAPRVAHQVVCGELYALLHAHFKSKNCRPFLSPIDVRLSEHDVVQPDLIVVCEPSKITETHIEGPPTLVVEILSPSTQRHDRVRKLRLYAQAGVKEYWILQPKPAMAEVLSLKGAGFQIAGSYTELDQLVSPCFPDLVLDLNEVFPTPSDGEVIDEVRETPPPYSTVGG